MSSAPTFTTQLYQPTIADSGGADIQIKVGEATGDLEFAVHRAGAVDQILGPDGWQSSDYWFVSKNVQIAEGTAWVHLSKAIVEHITYSNYHLLARFSKDGEVRKGILTGGDLIARPDKPGVNSGVELPPLPSSMQPSLARAASVTVPNEKIPVDANASHLVQPQVPMSPRGGKNAAFLWLLLALLVLALAWWLFSRSHSAPTAVSNVGQDRAPQISIDTPPGAPALDKAKSEPPKPEPPKPEPEKTAPPTSTASPMNKLMIDLLK